MNRFTLTQVFLFWVLGFGSLFWFLRKPISRWLGKFSLPHIVNYYSILLPVILLEEAFTIEVPYFWGILPIILAFYIMVFPVYLLQRWLRFPFWVSCIVMGCWGCFNEFILVGRIKYIDNGLVLLILVTLCFFIYAVMLILPSYYLEGRLRNEVGA